MSKVVTRKYHEQVVFDLQQRERFLAKEHSELSAKFVAAEQSAKEEIARLLKALEGERKRHQFTRDSFASVNTTCTKLHDDVARYRKTLAAMMKVAEVGGF